MITAWAIRAAVAAPLGVPAELEPWVPWVLHDKAPIACAWVADQRACAWPSALTVDAGPRGASFSAQVVSHAPAQLTLPGGPGAWPQDVVLDGRPAVVSGSDRPLLDLPAGRHEVRGLIPWNARPAALPLTSGDWGIVQLAVDGQRIVRPQIQDGTLVLGTVDALPEAGAAVEIDVARHIADGIPVIVTTRIGLAVSGPAREVDLGDPLIAGTRAVGLNAGVPVRLADDGHLVAQVRPGAWTIEIMAITDGSVDALAAPAPGANWPATETWTVRTDESLRAVNLGGAPAVDPARTTLPDEWRALPAFTLSSGQSLTFETLRRGAAAAADSLSLQRELWLDLDGNGLTVRDQFSGALGTGWRLDSRAPIRLGHMAVDGEDQLVTQGTDGMAGVELRRSAVAAVAEGRVDERTGRLLAVGWNTDVSQLGAVLYTGPGWTLLAATGVDKAPDALVSQWNLLDLFFVLLMALGTGRLAGPTWGLLAGLALALARHEAGAPQWMWVALLCTAALGNVVREGRGRLVQRAAHAVVAVALALLLVPFCVDQVESALHPALGRTRGGGWRLGAPIFSAEMADLAPVAASARSVADGWSGGEGEAKQKRDQKESKYLTAQLDPNAVVQTGPGIPTWQWNTWSLQWSGPVDRNHELRLWLLPPWATSLVHVLRVLALVVLGARLVRSSPAAASLLLAAMVCLPGIARAAPDPALLTELERRLVSPPACGATCVDIARVHAQILDDVLTLEVEVHARAHASVDLPGPLTAWSPERATLDGGPAALRRVGDQLQASITEGVHTLVLAGPVPPADAFTLQFPRAPHFTSFRAGRWTADGIKPDGTLDRTVLFSRLLAAGDAPALTTANLSPWIVVERHLDLGLPWRVRTTARQRGASEQPVSARIPLLPGESVTDAAVEVVEGTARVSLDRDHREVSWTSTLAETDRLELVAPSEGATEQWTVSCSPVFRCAQAEGPVPVRHVDDGRWWPTWSPLPGERLVLTVGRPAGLAGQTTTVDEAVAAWTPGRRALDATLSLRVRSSQGGRQVITLPPGAALRDVRIDDQPRPLQLRDDGTVHVPLEPRSQQVFLSWTAPASPVVRFEPPPVDIGGPAVNASVTVQPPDGRWLVWTSGPTLGPAVLYWKWLVILALLAPLLARVPGSPLGTTSWAVLGLGMSQIPTPAAALVVAWLVAVGTKERGVASAWGHNLLQVGVVVGTLAALVTLYAAIHIGLLWRPDMQVEGNASTDLHLSWAVDRIDGAMPQPTVLWLPMWVWRSLNLLWALWLASRLVAWLPRTWRALALGGWVRWPSPSATEAAERSGR